MHVLKWIFERCEGSATAKSSPVGNLPETFDAAPELFEIDRGQWKEELKGLREYFKLFGDRLPEGIHEELDNLESRLYSNNFKS